ncbi:uncharacterized protein BJX67DRAFT_286330 [Aspergillus lucknowensis]|uniref:Uncharacterized protein n=1 Tax=Aspergillus lucknowensis TaxID=176173 RepID=A0ABR4M0Z7_9EURO
MGFGVGFFAPRLQRPHHTWLHHNAQNGKKIIETYKTERPRRKWSEKVTRHSQIISSLRLDLVSKICQLVFVALSDALGLQPFLGFHDFFLLPHEIFPASLAVCVLRHEFIASVDRWEWIYIRATLASRNWTTYRFLRRFPVRFQLPRRGFRDTLGRA